MFQRSLNRVAEIKLSGLHACLTQGDESIIDSPAIDQFFLRRTKDRLGSMSGAGEAGEISAGVREHSSGELIGLRVLLNSDRCFVSERVDDPKRHASRVKHIVESFDFRSVAIANGAIVADKEKHVPLIRADRERIHRFPGQIEQFAGGRG